MNPKTLHTMQLLFSAVVLICLYISQNFPQYAPLCNDIAGFLATATAALAGHAMPTGPQAKAMEEVASLAPLFKVAPTPVAAPALPTYVQVAPPVVLAAAPVATPLPPPVVPVPGASIP